MPISHGLPETFCDTPRQLVPAFDAGAIEVGQMSVLAYLRRQRDYQIMDDLAIRSVPGQPLLSVLLVSRLSPRDLWAPSVGLSEESLTAARLTEHLFPGACLTRVPGPSSQDDVRQWVEQHLDSHDAVLLIGDLALHLVQASPGTEGLHVCDLAAEWWHRTELPFVFAVFVARRGCELSQEQREWLRANLRRNLADKELLREAGQKRGLREDVVPEYFRGLAYDLSSEAKRGLREFERVMG